MDFATGPAPHSGYAGAPPVPNGWAARFDERYQTWFYANTVTGQSQWEPPSHPVVPTMGTEDPNKPRYSEPVLYHASDEDLARRLQAEEEQAASQQRPVTPYDAPQYAPQQPPRPNSHCAPQQSLMTEPQYAPQQLPRPTTPQYTSRPSSSNGGSPYGGADSSYTHSTNNGHLAPQDANTQSLHGRKKSSWHDLKDALSGKPPSEENRDSTTHKIVGKISNKVNDKVSGKNSKDEKKDKKDGKSSNYASKIGKQAGKHAFGGGGEEGEGEDFGGDDGGGGDDGEGLGEVIGAIFG